MVRNIWFDTILGCYIDWINPSSSCQIRTNEYWNGNNWQCSIHVSPNYRDTQANLIAELLNISYQEVIDNYYEWVRSGYRKVVINDLFDSK